MSKSIHEQLKNFKAATIATAAGTTIPFSANEWVKDGVDHINISRRSASQLGKALNLDYVRNWEHKVLGPFRSLNSLWFFLRAKNRSDQIRSIVGASLREFVDKECGGFGEHLPNFRAMVLDSMYLRILDCPEIKAQMIKSVLPFDSYRENESGIRIRYDSTRWIIEGYEVIRKALKEGVAPDFLKIIGKIEGDVKELYQPILKQLVHEPTPEEIEDLLKKKEAEERRQQKMFNKKQQPPKPKQEQKPQVISQPIIHDIDTKVTAEELAGLEATVAEAEAEQQNGMIPETETAESTPEQEHVKPVLTLVTAQEFPEEPETTADSAIEATVSN